MELLFALLAFALVLFFAPWVIGYAMFAGMLWAAFWGLRRTIFKGA